MTRAEYANHAEGQKEGVEMREEKEIERKRELPVFLAFLPTPYFIKCLFDQDMSNISCSYPKWGSKSLFYSEA